MVGATNELRCSPKAALLRLEGGALPVCCAYSALFCAIAAAASGNMALIVEESRPELRLFPGEGGGRPIEVRDPSTFSFDMASLRRFDIGSWQILDSLVTRSVTEEEEIWFHVPFSPKLWGDSTPEMG